MGRVNVLRVYTPIQSIAYKELSFEIGMWLQIKKFQKSKGKHCMLVRKKMKKWARARQKYPRGCICGTWSLGCKDCVTPICLCFSVQLVPSLSCLFSLEIFNTKLSRYPEDALYARHGSRSCKNIRQARKRWRLENAVVMKRPVAKHGSKTREN